MKSLVRFTLAQKVFINLAFVLLMVVGTFAVFDLPVDRYPNVHMGKVIISAFLPGASPTDVETLVTTEIEEALEDLENVEYIRSRSYRERATVEIKFFDDTDYDEGFKELRFKVLSNQNDFPEDMDPPEFTEVNVDEWLPVVNVNLYGNRSNRALVLMAEEIKSHLEQISGVKEVAIQGEYTREFHIEVNPQKLIRYKVTFDEVARALQEDNVSIPAGDFESSSGEFIVRVDERFRSREQVLQTIIRRDLDGSFVTVGDIIESAELFYRDPFVISSINGQDSVSIKVVKTWDGNALDIHDEVVRVVDQFTPAFAKEGVEMSLTQEQRSYIEDAVNTLGSNMLVGIFLVVIVIWLVMGWRNAMLTTVGIPFSFLVTMVIMWLTGNSLNEITLFSFVLVTGIIVDDAIVVVENIFRHFQEGEDLKEAVINGTSEVFLPVIAATTTTMAAFLPMLIMSGSTGEFFALVPKAVSFAILASIVECLIILPSHFYDWPGRDKLKRGEEVFTRTSGLMEKLKIWADKLVVLAIRFKWSTLGIVMLGFFLALTILVVSIVTKYQLIRIEFFPDDYNIYYVEIEGEVATPISKTSEKLKEISKALDAMGPSMVRTSSALAGFYFNEDYEQVFGSNLGHVAVQMPLPGEQDFIDNPDNDPLEYLEYMRKEMAKVIGKEWTFRVRAEKGGPPAGKDVNVRTLGTDPQRIQALSNRLFEFLSNNEEIAPYLINLSDDQGIPNRVFRFVPKRDRVAEYGLTTAQVAALAGSVLDGRFVGKYKVIDEEVDIRLKIGKNFLSQPDDVLEIPVLEYNEGPVRLGDLCSITTFMEPGQLNRFNNQRSIALTANIKPGAPITPTSIANEVKAFYSSIKEQYPGATVNFSGEFESTNKSFVSLGYAFAIAVLIMYIILATQFQSYLQPVIILSAVIFSLTGVVFGTFLTRTLFTVNSFIATVGVAGVVVNDSLVLLDFMNRLYRSGMSRMEAIHKGVATRLRPILLTTLTTTLGLLPMALGIPRYSLVWGTMATTFVTGLCTATFLTIFVVPILWNGLVYFKEKQEHKKHIAL